MEGGFLSSFGSVDHPAGNNSVGEPGRHLGVHCEAVDVDAILDKGRERVVWFNGHPQLLFPDQTPPFL